MLQSNGGTAAKYNLSDWMIKVRQMEQNGGAMGLTETLNSNLTSSSGSNGIDVHMEKNTEYGAMAILSASSYGNPNVIADGQTTTGNVTGVVMKINKEWVAAGQTTQATNFTNAAGKYKNTYIGAKGDAVSETNGWHGSSNNTYFSHQPISGGFIRAYSRSIFSFYGKAGTQQVNTWVETYDATWNLTYASRAVIVMGADF